MNNCITTKASTYTPECCDCLELKTDSSGNHFLIKGDLMIAVGSSTSTSGGGGGIDLGNVPDGGFIGGTL